MNVGIYANPTKQDALSSLKIITSSLKEKGMTYTLDTDAGVIMEEPGTDRFFENADLILSVGGDGTMLECVHRMKGFFHTPIAGVNIGTLGFLTTCTESEFPQYAEHLANNELRAIELNMLHVEMKVHGGEVRQFLALNEVTLMRGDTGRIVTIEALIDGNYLTHYGADGLIVATPSGSTAYSLSAGGPIIAPGSGVFVVNPICPHALSNRALVVPCSSEITLNACGREPTLFSVDGRDVLRLDPDYPVTIKAAEDPLKLLQMPNSTYFHKIRAKLGWTGGIKSNIGSCHS